MQLFHTIQMEINCILAGLLDGDDLYLWRLATYIYNGPNGVNFVFSHNDEGRMSPRPLWKLILTYLHTYSMEQSPT